MSHIHKKVLFVVTKGSWGGAQRYVFDLAKALKNDHEVVVVVGSEGRLVTHLNHERIRTITVPSLTRDISIGMDIVAFFELLRVFIKERPTIVHLNSSKAGGVGALAARLARVPRIVYTVHGWAFNEPVSRISRAFRWVASLATMLLVHKTITVSSFDGLLTPLGLPAKTVHNGVKHMQFIPREKARAIICEKAHIPTDGFIFGSIAELHYNKGIDVLIEAAFLVDNAYVVVIGEGEERADLEKLITELHLTDRVHLIGFMDNAAEYLQAFDAFVLPSRKEGLPYAILEAGQAEVPIIASAVGGIPEVVHDQISGDLFHALNDLALAESMQEFKVSPNTIKEYAETLKAHVERYFSLDVMIQKTLVVYEH